MGSARHRITTAVAHPAWCTVVVILGRVPSGVPSTVPSSDVTDNAYSVCIQGAETLAHFATQTCSLSLITGVQNSISPGVRLHSNYNALRVDNLFLIENTTHA
jgi:hypothetical protein